MPSRVAWPALRVAAGSTVRVAVLVACVWTAACSSYIDVSPVMTLPMDAGEVQSTVVAPGLKAECPAGRFLASNDRALRRADENQGDTPPEMGTVMGRDLDDATGAPIAATFVDTPPDRTLRYHGNDHDLVVLPNGDVLLVDLTASIVPVDPQPVWWNFAYKMGGSQKEGTLYARLGPGARTSMLVYRSTDCGNTFHFFSEWDPAREPDDSCALPQFPSLETTPGTPEQPVYNMGGSDGPQTRVAPATGHVFMTHQCVGYQPDPDALKDSPRRFILQTQMNKTVFVGSTDGGASWTPLGQFGGAKWRSGIVPLGTGRLVFGANAHAIVGAEFSGGWQPTTLSAIQNIDPYPTGALKEQYGLANIWASQILSRVPDSPNKVVVAVPAQVGSAVPPGGIGPPRGNGYRIFLYDVDADQAVEIRAALPRGGDLDDFLIHLAAIDIGVGPVLLYWQEFDISENRATVRGRFILSGTQVTDDFQISRDDEPSQDFATDWIHTWPATPSYWAGDYQTGWGYAEPQPVVGRSWVHFYPVWPERTQVGYARVSVSIVGSPDALEESLPRPEFHPFIPPHIPVIRVDGAIRATVRTIDVEELPANAPELRQWNPYPTENKVEEIRDTRRPPG